MFFGVFENIDGIEECPILDGLDENAKNEHWNLVLNDLKQMDQEYRQLDDVLVWLDNFSCINNVTSSHDIFKSKPVSISISNQDLSDGEQHLNYFEKIEFYLFECVKKCSIIIRNLDECDRKNAYDSLRYFNQCELIAVVECEEQ